MDAFRRFASGGSSIAQFAKDVYAKGNITSEINSAVRQLVKESEQINSRSSLLNSSIGSVPLSETSSPVVSELCHLLEAALLHGMKEKLSITKMTAAVLGPRSPVKSPTNDFSFPFDFWPIIQILCHNQVSDSLMRLSDVYSDVGRCRSWLRLTLNEGLFGSYMEALTNDMSLLHGFYRSSAYIRDRDHMDLLKSILCQIDSLSFQLNYDNSGLNCWHPFTLKLIGLSVKEEPEPVMPAIDALDEVRRLERIEQNKKDRLERKQQRRNHLQSPSSQTDDQNSQLSASTAASDGSDSLSMTTCTVRSTDDHVEVDLDPPSRNHTRQTSIYESRSRMITPNISIINASDEHEPIVIDTVTPTQPTRSRRSKTLETLSEVMSAGGNSVTRKSGWSSSPPSTITTEANVPQDYSSVFNKYVESTEVALSSTPDIKDINFGSSPPSRKSSSRLTQENSERRQSAKFTIFNSRRQTLREIRDQEAVVAAGGDFEVIPKSIVLNNSEPETQEFLVQLPKIGNEIGLDEQDYKCNSCGRPIGMIYGRYRSCRFDGYNYCIDCHNNEEAVIPARAILNWDFKKYPVSKRNKKLLDVTDSDPLLDVKICSPNLYQALPEMIMTLDLRTQLFFLHAYVFTCQESVAFELRKLVWPREHLFEHVHLYSCSDLVQLSTGSLMTQIKRAIAFARKHVLSCSLCSQKGFICELCKSPQIIYPFDTSTTKRCEGCKAVFHRSCVSKDNKSLPQNCPRCLRLARRRMAESAAAEDLNADD